MIGYIIHHIIFRPIRNCLLGIGGIIRWFIFQFLNITFDKEFSKDLDYYLNTKNELVDKNGFTSAQKNMLVSFIVIIGLLLLVEKFEQ